MERLYDNAIKELKAIAEQGGITKSNLYEIEALTTIAKNIAKIRKEGNKMRRYRDYDHYDDYAPRHSRFDNRLERLMDCAEQYEYGKNRYKSGGDDNRIIDGLERMMCAMTGFIEETFDFAETPEEKEIIRKHIQEIKSL